jgi:ubiquinone/menaquinone biosynthesis C-methylase UbiE
MEATTESLGFMNCWEVYSGGQIYAAKASQLVPMRSGDRVLYAGVGPGEDAALAERLGAKVTCIDVAPKMLQKVESRFQSEPQRGCFQQSPSLYGPLTS